MPVVGWVGVGRVGVGERVDRYDVYIGPAGEEVPVGGRRIEGLCVRIW